MSYYSHPLPPVSKLPNNNGVWVKENIWKISPSMVGGLMGEMEHTYGITRDNCLAYIWERNQPEYFYECLQKHFPGSKTKKQWLEERLNPAIHRSSQSKQMIMNQIQLAIRSPTPRERWAHIRNAYSISDLAILSRQENERLKNNPKLKEDLKKLLRGEILRQVYTESGTIGEEEDIISFFRDGNFDGLIGQKHAGTNIYGGLRRGAERFNGKPFYWNDNKGTSKYPVYNVKISHRQNISENSTDEYFHNLRWYDTGMMHGKKIWGATAWGKLDGVLFGKTQNGQFYDIFEAKQRQSSGSMNHVNGKQSEKIQMQIYMEMIENEKERNNPSWRFEKFPQSRQTKTGAWLLQTQWNSMKDGKLNQSFAYLPYDEQLKKQIDESIKKACKDLWDIQIYQHRSESAVLNGKNIQKRILESVRMPNF